ncbi:MAG: ABC transporter permease subunit, partial [Phycisphaerae bacterium]
MANPIIQRELIGLLRTKRAFGLQLGLSLVLATLVLLRWPPDAQVNLTGDQSQQVFQLFIFGLMVGLILLAPVFPASSIVRERQQGTLALLLNSPLRPWDILIGKLVGVLGYVLILLILSLPAAAACWAMGGLSLGSQMFLAYGILTLSAVQYASAALFISTRAANTDTSLRATYGVVLLLSVVVLGPFEFLGRLVTGPLGTVLEWTRCISPIPAMMEILGQSAAGSSGIMSMEGAPVRYAILAGISILIFNSLTLSRLNLRMFDRPRNAGRITDERSSGAQVFRRIMYLWFFDPQRRSGLIGDSTNPVMVKEFRSSKFGRGYWMMRLIGTCLIVSLGLTLASAASSTDWGVEKMGGILVLLQMALLILVTPSLASGLISTEREG